MLDITQRIQALQLPESSYIIVGGSVLTALGLRELHDIDILTTPEVFECFRQAGWQQVTWLGQPGLRHDVFEMGMQVHGYYVTDLLEGAYYIEGVPYINIELLYAIKSYLRRPEDLRDIDLMTPYVPRFCTDCVRQSYRIVTNMYK
ncbi:hypothetical protein JNM87_03685 [Candidatus Saccharibacteria bacterium]|nr:hypothetical protein [Candidatus Saccharibacteria bacterium]